MAFLARSSPQIFFIWLMQGLEGQQLLLFLKKILQFQLLSKN